MIGHHLILDLYGAKNLSDLDGIKRVLRDASEACGATVLEVNTHYFEPQGGVTGVALLAESHMSIHTWPEHGYAAIDIFMCGNMDPSKAVDILKDMFQPKDVQCIEIDRGAI